MGKVFHESMKTKWKNIHLYFQLIIYYALRDKIAQFCKPHE